MVDAPTSFAALLAAGVLCMLPAAPAHADTDVQKLDTVRQMLRAWHELAWERVYALFAPDGVLQSVMTDPIVGRDSIREHIAPMAAGTERP